MAEIDTTFELLKSGLYRKIKGFIPRKTWGGCFKRKLIVKVNDEWLYKQGTLDFINSVDGWTARVLGDHTVTAKKVVASERDTLIALLKKRTKAELIDLLTEGYE